MYSSSTFNQIFEHFSDSLEDSRRPLSAIAGGFTSLLSFTICGYFGFLFGPLIGSLVHVSIGDPKYVERLNMLRDSGPVACQRFIDKIAKRLEPDSRGPGVVESWLRGRQSWKVYMVAKDILDEVPGKISDFFSPSLSNPNF